MILVFDVGNTSIAIGLYQKETLVQKWRIATELNKSADDYAVDIVELFLLQKINCTEISGMVIGSVVPTVTVKLKEAARKISDAKLLVVGESGVKLGVEIKVKNSHEVGADRLINTVAGYKKFGGNLIIIDFGTATTFDVIGNEGEYLGGVIAPGVRLAIKALYDMTAQLPQIKVRPQNNVIGKSTFEAMNSGIYFGYISMVEGMIKRIEKEYGSKTKRIVTGGYGELFVDALKNEIDDFDPDLTLYGMKLIYNKSK